MLLVIYRHGDQSYALPMRRDDQAFFGPGDSNGAGYVLTHEADDYLVEKLQSPIGHEFILSAMYEGGELCGVYDSTDDDHGEGVWSWALMPETEHDKRHINDVIVPYGRYSP